MNAVDRKLKIHTKNGSYSEGAANRSILTVTWDSNNIPRPLLQLV